MAKSAGNGDAGSKPAGSSSPHYFSLKGVGFMTAIYMERRRNDGNMHSL